MLAAVLGGAIALISSAFTAQAAPVSAVQVGKAAQSGEALVQKTGWHHRRHYHHHHRHYRPYYYSYSYTPRRHYHHHHHAHRPAYWRHQQYYGTHTYRAHRRHYH